MNSKERVRTAVSHEEPDRVPIFASFVPEELAKLKEHFKISDDTDLFLELGNDMIMLGYGFLTGYYMKEDDEYWDDWGCKWKYKYNQTGRYPEIVERPLDDKKNLDHYQIPDPNKPEIYEAGKKVIAKYGKDHWIFGCICCSAFESSFGLRGFENLLIDMAEDKDFVHALMDKVIEYPLAAGKHLIEMGVDMLWTGDDVGTQIGMIMSMDMWREFLKPRFARMYSTFKAIKPDIKLAYHSCGNCEAILDDMYEIGLDIINPIQPACMNPSYIKKRYGDKLTLWGGVDIQRLLPFGSRQDVHDSVSRLMKDCAPGGGFIISPAHNVQADTSVENILAFYDAAKKYGIYPI